MHSIEKIIYPITHSFIQSLTHSINHSRIPLSVALQDVEEVEAMLLCRADLADHGRGVRVE